MKENNYNKRTYENKNYCQVGDRAFGSSYAVRHYIMETCREAWEQGRDEGCLDGILDMPCWLRPYLVGDGLVRLIADTESHYIDGTPEAPTLAQAEYAAHTLGQVNEGRRDRWRMMAKYYWVRRLRG